MAHSGDKPLGVSVVIPVYSGVDTLPQLLVELAALTSSQVTPKGRKFAITEVLLVWDRGPGRSDEIIRQLKVQYPFVKPIWLSRNFGQHAATLAGMTSASGDWIVTMDEDGQQDPAYIRQNKADFYCFFREADRRHNTDFLTMFPEMTTWWAECECHASQS